MSTVRLNPNDPIILPEVPPDLRATALAAGCAAVRENRLTAGYGVWFDESAAARPANLRLGRHDDGPVSQSIVNRVAGKLRKALAEDSRFAAVERAVLRPSFSSAPQ